jgi:NDP-sugar pyrophosphorylase family protein
MRRSRVTITLQQRLLSEIDKLIDGQNLRNRSQTIEFILNRYFLPNIKKAVILAGGKGTKLRPYTYEIPKALLPIKGKPLLQYLIENLKNNHIAEIIICTGYLGEKIKEHFGDGQKLGVKITYSQEKSPRQTGGAVSHVQKQLANQSFLVVYGDIATNLSLTDLIAFHQEHKPLATIALTTAQHPEDFGQLQLHGIKLVNFYQKGKSTKVKSNLINCGIYIFEPAIFDFFPKDRESFLLEEVIEDLIKKKKVNGFVFEEQWFDVGNPKNYEEAIKEFLPLTQKS